MAELTPGDTYTQRLTVRFGPYPIELIRRPISVPADEGQYGFLDDGTAEGWSSRPLVGQFRNGAWKLHSKRKNFEPTHWSAFTPSDAPGQ